MAKITDFGVSTVARVCAPSDDGVGFHLTSDFGGCTPTYMSPNVKRLIDLLRSARTREEVEQAKRRLQRIYVLFDCCIVQGGYACPS